ncbi:MAG: ABC transporter ATP-binding protein [Longimicrobiales bacterium]
MVGRRYTLIMTPPASPSRATPYGVLRHYWRVAGVRPWHIIMPTLLVLIAGLFEAASFSLLLPLTSAVADNSFDFLNGSRPFGWILALVPESLADSPSRGAFLVVVTVALIVAGRIGKLVLEYFRKLYVVARTERYRVAVGEETFGRVLQFGRQYFEGHSLGKIDAEIGWSSSVIGLLTAAEEVFRYVIGLVTKAFVMIAISLPLSIAFIITLPFVQWFMTAINTRVRRISAQGVEVDRRVRSSILDILGSIPLVKAYSQEKVAADAYVGVLREAEDVAVRRDRVISLRYPVEEMAVLLVMVLVQGAVIYVAGDFRPGDLASFGAFLLILQQSLPDYKHMSMFSVKLAEEWPRLEAVAGLFTDEGKFMVPSGPRTFTKLEREVSVRGLSFQYQPGVDTLVDIHTTLVAGKVTAVVGRTGAGKTTFVDLIARFYDCEPGRILLDGVDIREYSLASLHSRMAIVSQEVWLLNRTLRDNLTFGLARKASDEELSGALRDVDLDEFVAGLREGLDTEIGDRGVRLSGGQRQRVALARALLRDPDILILDEATSALDSLVEQRVARAIQQRAKGRTLIVIAHRLSTIRDADLILVMHEGRVIEQGNWDELLRMEGAFYRLHQAQYGKDTPVSA